MSAFTSALEAFGLTQSEALIYETGLKETETDIAQLSRLLHMNRATAYHAVHELEQRGLLKKRIENGRMIITMSRDEAIDAFFAFQEARLKEHKETLKHFFEKLPAPKKKIREPDVEYFSGYEGVQTALERAYRAKNKHWDIIAPKRNFFSEVDEEYAAYYLRERKKRGIISRSLWESSFKPERLNKGIVQERQPRFLPESCNGTFRSVVILFDERALFISSKNEMQATLINSPDVCSILQMQFNALWEISSPVTF